MVLEVGGVGGSGQGVSTDILEAGARAYVRALSNAVRRHGDRRRGRGARSAGTASAVSAVTAAVERSASASPCR